jgi:hypothetical protein
MLAYAMWPSDRVAVASGAEFISRAPRNERLTMCFCSACGGNLMAESGATRLVDVFPMILKNFRFEPIAHVNYAERVIDMRDGLPKFRDMPQAAGGSGERIVE